MAEIDIVEKLEAHHGEWRRVKAGEDLVVFTSIPEQALEEIKRLRSDKAGMQIALEQAWQSNREREAELVLLRDDDVTPEMIAAGMRVLNKAKVRLGPGPCLADAYMAMRAARKP